MKLKVSRRKEISVRAVINDSLRKINEINKLLARQIALSRKQKQKRQIINTMNKIKRITTDFTGNVVIFMKFRRTEENT